MALNLARVSRLRATFHTLPLFYKTWRWKSTLAPVFQKLLRKKKARFVKFDSISGYHHLGVGAYFNLKLTLSALKLSRNDCIYSRNPYLLKSSSRFPNVLYQCSFSFIPDQNEKKKTRFLSSTSPPPVQKDILFKTLYRKIVDTAFLRLNKIPKTIFS